MATKRSNGVLRTGDKLLVLPRHAVQVQGRMTLWGTMQKETGIGEGGGVCMFQMYSWPDEEKNHPNMPKLGDFKGATALYGYS